eukprot:Pgem_evm2s19740
MTYSKAGIASFMKFRGCENNSLFNLFNKPHKLPFSTQNHITSKLMQNFMKSSANVA